MLGLIAKKIGMSRIFAQDGTATPVTYLAVEPNTVVRHRVKDKDGYDAVVLGVGEKKQKTRKGKEHVRYQMERELPVDSLENFAVGSTMKADAIPAESLVSIVGISKGKGFAGVVKRHNFSRGSETHGSHHHREPGSVGTRAKPGRVRKGKRLPGRMGRDQITLKHIAVVVCDPKENLLAVKGPIPGANGSRVLLRVESLPNAK